MTAPLLLALAFANGIGLAMRWPVFSAIVPELVPRAQLPAALALNGVAMNASRIVGPLVAGALIASAGSAYVFVLNAVLSVVSGFVVLRWRREHTPNPLGRERLLSAMRVGVQFVRQSPRMRAVLVRIALFFFHSTALLALLPLVARGLPGGGAGTFTLLLASMGAGAIVAALSCRGCARPARATGWCSAAPCCSRWRSRWWRSRPTSGWRCRRCSWPAWPGSRRPIRSRCRRSWRCPTGCARAACRCTRWRSWAPSAFGAAVWGQVATIGTVRSSLLVGRGHRLLMMVLAQRSREDGSIEEDLRPASAGWAKVPGALAEPPPRSRATW